jgi:hypothetical protein
MVERVARGRISVPAAAAIGAVSAGLLVAGSAFAAGRDATLQIRVQVVDSCEVRLNPGGGLEQACGSGARLPPALSMARGGRGSAAVVMPSQEAAEAEAPASASATGDAEAPDRSTAANQRANGVAAQIVERVRYITLTY